MSKRFPNVKVLALTMHAEESYIMNMVKAGAFGYILKESSKEELFQAVETVAGGKKYYSNDVSVTMINSMMSEPKKTTNTEISEREQEVLSLIIDGLTNIEIGKALHISNRTVESHRRNILQKCCFIKNRIRGKHICCNQGRLICLQHLYNVFNMYIYIYTCIHISTNS